jgi:hypothetical protein
MGIINGCFSFNNMSTYEESCSFASLPSTHRQQPKSQQEQHRKEIYESTNTNIASRRRFVNITGVC